MTLTRESLSARCARRRESAVPDCGAVRDRSEAHALLMGKMVAKIAADAGVPYIFKAPTTKRTRSSLKAFPSGIERRPAILRKIKSELKLPILTTYIDVSQAEPAAELRTYCRFRRSRAADGPAHRRPAKRAGSSF